MPAGLYDSTQAFAFHMSVRGGVDILLTPRVNLMVTFYGGWTLIGAPDNAPTAGNPINDADANSMMNFQLGLMISVGIRIPTGR